MAFLDFLKPRKPDDRQPTIADLEGKLEELRESRERSASFLAGIEDRRARLLIDDAAPQKIIALDAEADAARIALEKADIFEAEIAARMAALRGAENEAQWREKYDAMHAAAMAHTEKMRAAFASLHAFREAAGGLSGFGREMRRPEPAPVILGSEILERWLRDLEANHDFERARRERQGV